MSRRDTIIIAVLVNAALLMILFATAIRSGDSKDEGKKNTEASVHEMAKASKSPEPMMIPIQDDLLNELVSSVPTLTELAPNLDSLSQFDETELAILSQMNPPQASAVMIDPLPNNRVPNIAPSSPNISGLSSPKEEGQVATITVKKGDYLEKIAKANHTTIAAIMDANHLTSTNLKIGQVLKVPLTKSEKKNESPNLAQAPTQTGEYYIVKEGDNPWLIASRNKINLEELLRLNNLDDQKAKKLRPGDKLKIR